MQVDRNHGEKKTLASIWLASPTLKQGSNRLHCRVSRHNIHVLPEQIFLRPASRAPCRLLLKLSAAGLHVLAAHPQVAQPLFLPVGKLPQQRFFAVPGHPHTACGRKKILSPYSIMPGTINHLISPHGKGDAICGWCNRPSR